MNLGKLLRYLAGWRLTVLGVGLVVAVVVLWVGLDLTAAGGLAVLVSLLALLLPLLLIVARLGVLSDDRESRLATKVGRFDGVLGRGAGSLEDLTARIDRLDEVVADTTRKPWDPTTLPWPTPVGTTARILLLPSAAYHLAEIMPLTDALNRRGYETIVAVGEAHWPRIATGLGWYDTPVFALPEATVAVAGLRAVVTMKDWAGYGEVVSAAKGAGVVTFAKVEGAQDFSDADTPYARNAYRTADHILCQGKNDFDALAGSRYIVGSSRLERLFHAPVMPITTDHVVINLNFTYGVLEEQRTEWIESAVAACEQLRVPYTVAIHPAERRSRRIPHASTVPISRLLLRAGALVSRFSTVPFEAMARGVPFVYHNPHGEKVSTFADGGDAFRTTISAAELAAALEEVRGWRDDYRSRCAPFFTRQIDIDPSRPSEDRAADVIAERLGII
jgi:hypothetical protein